MSKFKVGDEFVCLCGQEECLGKVLKVYVIDGRFIETIDDSTYHEDQIELLSVYESPLYKALL